MAQELALTSAPPWRRRLRPLSGLILSCVLLGLGFAGLSSGCGAGHPVLEEVDERAYQRGKAFIRQGRIDEALLAFLSVIDARTEAPESHLEAGKIYLENKDNPLLAIYHFTRYLEFRPQSPQAPIVQEMILSGKKAFARTLPGRPFEDHSVMEDLTNQLERLRAENLELRRLLAQERRRVERLEAASGTSGNRSPATPDNGGSRPANTYVVQPGDTLTSISRQVYGTTGRWEEIFAANRGILRSANDLRPGQVLSIP